MPLQLLERIKSLCLTVVLTVALTALAASPLQAQERRVDTGAPVVEIEIVTESEAGTQQIFTAQVADDRELASVTLHHRREGEQPFSRVMMSRLGDSDYYTVSLSTQPEDERSIEYYVQAIDENGNRTVNGFAFDPRIRMLTPASTLALRSAPSEVVEASPPRNRNWWKIALGVVAVGALVSLSGSDDSGGDNGVPLTIDVPEPASR